MRRSRTDQKSGSWSHMEIDLSKNGIQRFRTTPCKQSRYRSNSFSACGCQQTEQMAGSIKLFYLYEDKNSKNVNNVNNANEKNKFSTVEHRMDEIFLSFIDLPTGHVKLKNLNSWDFNIFHLRKISCNYTIREIGLQILDEYDLFRKMKLDYFLMARIFSAVEAVYHNFNPYHTALHAADVLQAVHCFISHTKLSSILNPTEIFSVLLAAAFHDVDHPGVNQSYLEKTGDFLVDLYKSVSVLEKHHAKVGLCILKESGLSKSLEIKDWEIVRDCFLQVIPATDITYQGIYRKQFTELTKYHIANPSVPFTVSDRTLFMQMVLKCADISNPCRNWPVCEEWAKRVCTELFCQGDRERFQWLLQPIPVMDRTKFTLQRLQIGFIRDMVKPLFIAWHEFCQTGLTLKVLQYLENNLKIWLSQMSDLEVKYPPAFYRLGSLDSQSSDSLTRQQTVSSSFVHADRSDGREENELEISDVKTEIGLHKPLITSVHITTPSSTELEKLKKYESVDSNSCSTSGNLQQTVFITTRVIRRHSLPETQVAIRKTFDFSLSKKSSTVIILKSDPQHIWQSDTSAMLPFTSANNNNNSNNNSNSNNLRISLDKLKLQSLSLHQSATAGTRSANILQMLCEEIINNKSIAKTDLNSMPKSFCFKNNKLQQKILDLNHEQSFLRFSALAHRRRSAPIMEH